MCHPVSNVKKKMSRKTWTVLKKFCLGLEQCHLQVRGEKSLACLLANTSSTASLSSSSASILISSSLASFTLSRSLLSTTNIRPEQIQRDNTLSMFLQIIILNDPVDDKCFNMMHHTQIDNKSVSVMHCCQSCQCFTFSADAVIKPSQSTNALLPCSINIATSITCHMCI